ncbi:hypothetical protein T10_4555 [Trichinella papuae]|uniref:Uncharacterized protein n=1 Tax=Trichinella papuae TaxID=268474 RepID=A0A0V1MEN1_9BILA|nr:hypothetical protein T10_4555 [Trichinella papuae]
MYDAFDHATTMLCCDASFHYSTLYHHNANLSTIKLNIYINKKRHWFCISCLNVSRQSLNIL